MSEYANANEEGWFDKFESDLSLVAEQSAVYSTSKRYSENPIVKKTFDFSLSIIDFNEQLQQGQKYEIANQVLRSGTAIGANVREAQNAESLKDFLHKLKIALKEADETEYWLLLCKASPHYPDTDHLVDELQHILRILNKIVQTTKQRIG